MKKLDTKAMLLNGAAALVVLGTVGAMLRSYVVSDDIAPCSQRYEKATRFALERNGAPMSPSDLQARFSGTDWGVLERARVMSAKGTAVPLSLELAVGAGEQVAAPAKNAVAPPQKPGVGFVWTPQGVKAAAAACLAYSMQLPEKFDFAHGGRLPGLLGSDGGTDEQASTTFSIRPRFARDGNLLVHTELTGGGEQTVTNERKTVPLPLGRWVEIEQEVVLNTPGQANGIVRLWMDGRVAFERSNVAVRKQQAAGVTGVLAEFVAFNQAAASKPEARKLKLTPFEIYWR